MAIKIISGLTWTLTDHRRVVINSREGVAIALDSTVTISLDGDDLKYSDGAERVLDIEETYNSATLGNDRRLINRNQISVIALSETSFNKWPNLSWSDAPAALVINDDPHKDPAYNAVWGLPETMSIEDAWADFDHADEYEIVE